jgi:hypothetical protein
MIMLVLGALLIGIAAVLDSFFRARMQRIGDKWALLQGGAFDYSRYHKICREQGLPAWLVYVCVCGPRSPTVLRYSSLVSFLTSARIQP